LLENGGRCPVCKDNLLPEQLQRNEKLQKVAVLSRSPRARYLPAFAAVARWRTQLPP
jgi:hypothetical protein